MPVLNDGPVWLFVLLLHSSITFLKRVKSKKEMFAKIVKAFADGACPHGPGPQGKNGHGGARQTLVTGPCGYRAGGVSIRSKFVLTRNLGDKTRGSACG